MANEDKKKELRQKSRFAAMEGLRPHDGLPLPPRIAMRHARRASKKLGYPLPPYAGTFLPILLLDAKREWDKLGKWQRVALPAMVLVGLVTWEQEIEKRERFQVTVDRSATKARAAEVLASQRLSRLRKRKLFGVIPLPGKRK